MKIIVLILSLIVVSDCFAEVVLYRYFDKNTGEERGISYSGNNGSSSIENSLWNKEIISEEQKQYYLDLQNKQRDAQPKSKSLEERVTDLEKTIVKPD